MQVLSYVSKSLISRDDREFEMGSIVRSAQENNYKSSVTGVLFFSDGMFFQTIEGPGDAVSDTYAIIEKDKRHKDLLVLLNEPITERQFSNWSMEGFYHPTPQTNIQSPLIDIKDHVRSASVFTPASLADFTQQLMGRIPRFNLA